MDKIYYFTFDKIRNKINTDVFPIIEEKKDCYTIDSQGMGILTVVKSELDKPIFEYEGFSMFSLKNNPHPLIKDLKTLCVSTIANKLEYIEDTIFDIKDYLKIIRELEK